MTLAERIAELAQAIGADVKALWDGKQVAGDYATNAALALKANKTTPSLTGPVVVSTVADTTQLAGVNSQVEALQIIGTGAQNSSLGMYAINDTTANVGLRMYRRLISSAFVMNSALGTQAWYAWNGASYRPCAQIAIFADGDHTTTSSPTRLSLITTPVGSVGAFEPRLTIKNDGKVGIGTITPTELLDVAGTIKCNAVRTTTPVTKTTAFAVADSENWLIINGTASVPVTLPAAASYIGRAITIKTISAFTVVSASSNVVPLVGGAAGTALLAATAGKWASLVSDGTNWIVMQGN